MTFFNNQQKQLSETILQTYTLELKNCCSWMMYPLNVIETVIVKLTFRYTTCAIHPGKLPRDISGLILGLQSNAVSHWLGTNLESALHYIWWILPWHTVIYKRHFTIHQIILLNTHRRVNATLLVPWVICCIDRINNICGLLLRIQWSDNAAKTTIISYAQGNELHSHRGRLN